MLRIVAGLDRGFRRRDRAAARHASAWCFRNRACCRGAPSRTTSGWSRRPPTTSTLAALFDTLGLAAHRAHFPGELSLGLARRVALARAFAVEPQLLILDEPFASLDQPLAARLRDELAMLVDRRPVTTLLVTHDLDEAVRLADRLFLLSARPARILADVPIPQARDGAPARTTSRRSRPTLRGSNWSANRGPP